MDNDGFVSNGELFQVLKMMVGNNLKDTQLQQIVDKTIILYDKVSLSIDLGWRRKIDHNPIFSGTNFIKLFLFRTMMGRSVSMNFAKLWRIRIFTQGWWSRSRSLPLPICVFYNPCKLCILNGINFWGLTKNSWC